MDSWTFNNTISIITLLCTLLGFISGIILNDLRKISFALISIILIVISLIFDNVAIVIAPFACFFAVISTVLMKRYTCMNYQDFLDYQKGEMDEAYIKYKQEIENKNKQSMIYSSILLLLILIGIFLCFLL